MIKKALLSITLLFCSLSILAQNSSIKGKVVAKDKTPIAFVTVLLFVENENEAFTGTTTDDTGNFIFESLEKKQYRFYF